MSLNGIRVLVTRPAQQAQNLSSLLEQHGAIPVLLPTLAIEEVHNDQLIADTLQNPNGYQWLIFISVNAVNFALKANGGKIPASKWPCVAAVGQATANALTAAGFSVQAVPEQGFNSATLLAMPQLQQVQGQQVLIVRGVGGREELADTLRARGAQVTYLEVYKRIIPSIDSSAVRELLSRNNIQIITVTSSEALQNLLIMLGENNHKLLFELLLVVVSDRIKDIAAEMGFKRITVTKNPSDAALLDTVITSAMGS
ncbi:MAG: uroporphyrinogen-III synthase [Methylococcales bacterium]